MRHRHTLIHLPSNNYTKQINLLEETISQKGRVLSESVFKVDSFLNHLIEPQIISWMGEEFARRFTNKEINKVLTIEASGIAIGFATAQQFGVPLLFAKKSQSINVGTDVYSADVYSFTHQCTNHILVSKRYISPDDKILIVDDFLANGAALRGLIEVCRQAGDTVQGIGIAVEKGFQPGGAEIRQKGFQLESLAIVESMDPASGKITFRQ